MGAWSHPNALLPASVQKAYRHKRFEVGKWSGTVPIGYQMDREQHFNRTKVKTEWVETGLLIPEPDPSR